MVTQPANCTMKMHLRLVKIGGIIMDGIERHCSHDYLICHMPFPIGGPL